MSDDPAIQRRDSIAGKSYNSIDTPEDSNPEWAYVTNKNAQKRSDHTTRSIIIIHVYIYICFIFV